MQQVFQSYSTVVIAVLSLVMWIAIPTLIAVQKGRDWKMWTALSFVLPVTFIILAAQNKPNDKLWLSLSAFTPLFSLLVLIALPQKKPAGGDQSRENTPKGQKPHNRMKSTEIRYVETPTMDAPIVEKNHHPTAAKGKGTMPSNSDVTRILQSETWAETLEATCLHFNELIEKHGHHEDYERDACSELVSEDSPFSKWFGAAYEDQTGEAYSEEEGITFDDLRGFAFSQDDEFIFNFLMNYLSAMRRDGSKLPGISKTESKNWKPMIEASLIQTIKALSEA